MDVDGLMSDGIREGSANPAYPKCLILSSLSPLTVSPFSPSASLMFQIYAKSISRPPLPCYLGD